MNAPFSFGESADALSMRAGQLSCACGPVEGEDAGSVIALWKPAVGFGLAVLAQALILSVLPDASRLLAPTAASIGWPFALLLIGAALASFPAAFLIDAFGRRAAFALGSSLGVAGGALAFYAITKESFPALCLGAFWLGLAQGFALFYRHISTMGAGGGAFVFSGGAIVALVTPTILAGLGGSAGATLIGAAAVYVAALGVATRLPHGLAQRTPISPSGNLDAQFATATLVGAVAWFLMAAAMLHGPLSLTACSATSGFIGGAIAWHLLAMYAPAALLSRRPAKFSDAMAISGGLALMFMAAGLLFAAKSEIALTGALIATGLGWSVVNVGALSLLRGRGSRLALAAHDMCLLSAAAAGALLT